MRILDNSTAMLTLEQPASANNQALRRSFSKPYGMVLVVGPTGSGKSTTLYATLNILNSIEKNIITVEGPGGVPPRRYQPGADAQQGQADICLRPAKHPALRPDIVLIGDPRPRDGADRRGVGPHRAPGTQHAAHERCSPAPCDSTGGDGDEPFSWVQRWTPCSPGWRAAVGKKCRQPYAAHPEVLAAARFPARRRRSRHPSPGGGVLALAHGPATGDDLALHEIMPVTAEIERRPSAHRPTRCSRWPRRRG